MQGPINVKSPNNTIKWQMGFNSAFKGLMPNFWFLNADFPNCAVHDPVCDADSFSVSPFEKYIFQSLLHRML
jgi:hypothetical protein